MGSISTMDLITLGIAANGLLPDFYESLFSQGSLTRTQHDIIVNLWNTSIMQVKKSLSDNQVANTVVCGSVSSLVRLSRVTVIPFKKALYELEKKKLVTIYKHRESISGVELSVKLMFSKMKVSPGLYDSLENIIYGYSRKEDEIMRNPIVSLRFPIVGLRSAITGIRSPIINRVPVKLFANKSSRQINFTAKKYEGLTESQKNELLRVSQFGQKFIDKKLEWFKDIKSVVFTEDELDCLENMVPYYENLICKHCNLLSYPLLTNSQYKKRSKNWTPLWKTYSLCKEHNWSFKIYLDSQFESYSNWGSKNLVKFPLPNMLYSERAVKAYEAYVYRNEGAYQRIGRNIRAKAKNTGNFKEEIERNIERAVLLISTDLLYWSKKTCDLFDNISGNTDIDSIKKSKSIIDHWNYDLPEEYLAATPNFICYIGDEQEYVESIQKKIHRVKEIQDNPIKMKIINETISKIERNKSIPRTFDLLKMDKVFEMNTQELW